MHHVNLPAPAERATLADLQAQFDAIEADKGYVDYHLAGRIGRLLDSDYVYGAPADAYAADEWHRGWLVEHDRLRAEAPNTVARKAAA